MATQEDESTRAVATVLAKLKNIIVIVDDDKG